MEPAALASKLSRLRGWILVVLGSLLSVSIALIAAFLASIVSHNDQSGASRWTGTPDFTAHVFELFALIFLFGLVALGGGVFQLRRERVSKLALVAMILLVAVMFFVGRGIVSAGAAR
jgi:uncharacterized membrane protein